MAEAELRLPRKPKLVTKRKVRKRNFKTRTFMLGSRLVSRYTTKGNTRRLQSGGLRLGGRQVTNGDATPVA